MAHALEDSDGLLFLLLHFLVRNGHHSTVLGQGRLGKGLARFGENVSFYFCFSKQQPSKCHYFQQFGSLSFSLCIRCSALRKFTIRNHMTFGGIAILCSPIQLFTPFTAAWKKRGVNNWYRKVHRYSGRVYVICAILSFIFGQWFIFLKEFVLVGGYNMGVAFSAAGFAIAYFAYMTWKTAPTNNPDGRYTVTDHRNWAIRSVAQIVAPVLYRYWYTLLLIFKVYQTPYLNGGDNEGKDKLVCNDRDVCGDYLRPFDFLFCWLYWLSAWAVAEIIILFLPEHKSSATMPGSEDPMEAPLLTTTPESGGNSNAMENGQVEGSDNKSAPRVVNFVGCLLAVLTIVVSGPIMIGLVASIFKKK